MNDERRRKAQGRARVRLGNANMIKVFEEIAKEPSSFSELLKKTRLTRPALTDHLRFLMNTANAIYPEARVPAIEPHKTHSRKIGRPKVVYRAKVDEIPRMLEQVLSFDLLSLTEPLEDNKPDWKMSEHKQKLDRELLEHKKAIVKALTDYINEFNIKREQALELEKENLKLVPKKKPEE